MHVPLKCSELFEVYFFTVHDGMLGLFFGESTQHLFCEGCFLFEENLYDINKLFMLSNIADGWVFACVLSEILAEIEEMTEVPFLSSFFSLLALLLMFSLLLEPLNKSSAVDDLS